MDLGPWGDLTILAAVMEMVFATCVFVYIGRLEKRTSHPLGEQVGAHKAVLAKLRKRAPMSREEVEYASELVADARSPLAYAIPAALFTIGFFYVVGCLFMLHLDGGHPSFRTFIGGIPMLTSINMAVQLRKVARLQGRLPDVTAQSVAALRRLGLRPPTEVADEPHGVTRRADASDWRGEGAP